MRGRELLFPGNPEKHARLLTMAELLENASKIKATLVPTTPSVFYTTQWQKYVKWTHINGISNENMYTEVVLLVYFDHLSKAYSPSSSRMTFSCLNRFFQIEKRDKAQ